MTTPPRRVATTLLIALSMSGSLARAAQERPPTADPARQIPGRDLRRNPLNVTRMFLKPLDGGKTALIVVVDEEKLPPTITISFDGRQQVVLRDEGTNGDERAGDREFTGIVTVPPRELEDLRKQGDALMRSEKITRFDGRRIVQEDVRRLINIDDIRARRLIPIPRPGILPPPTPVQFADDRSLMITGLDVVDDPTRTVDPCTGAGTPMGKWTFGHLMTEMANEPATGVRPADFTARWLRRWMFDQTVNDWTVPKRALRMQTFINNWPKVPGTDDLDLAKAPFRLLAIVNRVDLRENLTYGGGSAGEARFVFTAVENRTPNDPNNPNCDVMQFTVIFEYGIKKNGCFDLKAWAKQWTDLSALTGPAFNAALEAITESFVKRDADPAKPNGSALNQLRTNEIAIGGGPWELREFQVSAGGSDFHHLRQETVKQTPDISLNLSATVTSYVTANAADIVADKHAVPLEFPPGVHFMGGAAPVPGNVLTFHWDGNPKITTYLEREKFSLATCNGCHAGETKTQFTHINPAKFGTVAGLSSFLTGTPDTPPGGFKVDDPAGTPNASFFSDLKRRHDDLAALVGSSCFPLLFHRPLPMPH